MLKNPAFGFDLDEPYFTKDKWVSPYYFANDVQSEVTPPRKVHIHDVTLRDGEQAPRIAFTPDEKIMIALELNKLGVHSIEPGLPATPEDRDVIRQLIKMGLKSKIVPLCRVKEEDVKACLDLKPDGVLLEIAINPYFLRDVYNKTPESLIDEVAEYAKEFRRQGRYIEFMGWDAFRVPAAYPEQFFTRFAEKVDVDRITVADTFGMSHPLAMFKFIRKMRQWTGKPIGLHIHNDFGLATANSVMAISAGADMVHTSVNGIGERTGNVATEEVALALQHLFNIDCGIDLSKLTNISEIVAEISKVERARNKPVGGAGIFEVESGIIVHVIDNLSRSEVGRYGMHPYKPSITGREDLQIVAGRGTGHHSTRLFLEQRGIKADQETIERITERIKQAALSLKNALPKSLLDEIIAEELKVLLSALRLSLQVKRYTARAPESCKEVVVGPKRAALIEIVGEKHVCDDPRVLESFASDCSYAPRRKPWFVVRPSSAEEVQKLVLWANDSGTPLIAVSSGPPHLHGDTVPSVPEGVIVDLSRMKSIKRIDRRNKMVIVEPGVTYAELEPALAKEGLRISRPLQPRANKSVIASLLERQPTLIPRFNYSLPEPLRTCGVVWGTGEIAFTGEAGNGPADLESQWKRGVAQIDPKGPNATDLMRLLTGAQGSMGIVIWASIKCELIPGAHKFVFIPGEKLEDLVDFCYKVNRIRLGDEVMVVNAAQLAMMLGLDHSASRLPAWTVIIGLAGAALFPEERVQVQELDLKRLVQQCGLTILEGLPGIPAANISSVIEKCSGEPYFKFAAKGACQDVFFLTTLDKVSQFIATVYGIAGRLLYNAREISVYIQPQHHGVAQHVEFSLPYDPTDPLEAPKVKRIFEEVSSALCKQGAYFSRPYGSWADLVYRRDADATRVLRTVKHIVDPRNILNPGKLCF